MTGVSERDEGSYLLYKYRGKPMCIIKIIYIHGLNFVNYDFIKSITDEEMDVWDYRNIGMMRHMYKLNNEELLAYLL